MGPESHGGFSHDVSIMEAHYLCWQECMLVNRSICSLERLGKRGWKKSKPFPCCHMEVNVEIYKVTFVIFGGTKKLCEVH